MRKTRIPIILVMLVFIGMNIFLVSINSMGDSFGVLEASYHWLGLIIGKEPLNIYLDSLASDGSRLVFALMQTDDEIKKGAFSLAVFDEEGGLLGINEYVEIEFPGTGTLYAGKPLAAVYHDCILYVVTSTSILFLIDADPESKNFLQPLSAYFIHPKESIGKTYLTAIAVNDRYIYVSLYSPLIEPVIIVLLREEPKEVFYSKILSYEGILRNITWIEPLEGRDAVIVNAYYGKEVYTSSIMYLSLRESSITWSWSLSSGSSKAYGASISHDTEKVYTISAGDDASYLYIFDLEKGEFLCGSKYIADEPFKSLRLNHIELASDGFLYVVGTVDIKEYLDIIAVRISPLNGDIVSNWVLHGDYNEYITSPYQASITDYIWIGSSTSSFGYENSFSALISLISPALEDGDRFAWKEDKPPISYPSEPFIMSIEISQEEVKPEPLKIFLRDIDIVSEPADKIYSQEVKLSQYLAINDKTPEPVPEPYILSIIAFIVLFIASIVFQWYRIY